MLPYTICFCLCGDSVLMLYRRKPPNKHRWNGLGGKRERDESPLDCVRREVLEESGVDLNDAAGLRFAGTVTWPTGADPTSASRGMYAYVATLPPDWPVWDGGRHVPEGMLCWQPVAWVCDPSNPDVVDNIPHILPLMLEHAFPVEYYCDYRGDDLVGVVARPLEAGWQMASDAIM